MSYINIQKLAKFSGELFLQRPVVNTIISTKHYSHYSIEYSTQMINVHYLIEINTPVALKQIQNAMRAGLGCTNVFIGLSNGERPKNVYLVKRMYVQGALAPRTYIRHRIDCLRIHDQTLTYSNSLLASLLIDSELIS